MKYIKVLFRQYTQAIVLRIYLLSSLLEAYCHFYSLIVLFTRLGDKMVNIAQKRVSMIKYVMRLLLRVDIPFPSYHKKEWGEGVHISWMIPVNDVTS